MLSHEIVPEGAERDHVGAVFELLLNAFVSRVNLRILIRMVMFARSA